MKKILKIQLIALMALFVVMGLSVDVEAAQTFEYKFEPNEAGNAEKLNGTANLKKMVITFDKPISNLKLPDTLNQHIYIQEVGKTDKLDILQSITITPMPVVPVPSVDKMLTITFENIDFIDYTTMKDFELVIGKEVLQFDQINDYVLPFTIQDVLPGFESLFITQSATDINNKIFINNPPRDIMLHVPNIYIEQIETIHRYKGIIVGEDLKEKKPSTHQLSNIDVLANPLVKRLKVNFGVNPKPEYYRDLGRHPDIEGFTMGQAGITAITEENKANATDKFELKAYNEFGRLLETRHFPLLVIDKDKNFKYNGYLSKPDPVFGSEISLYELMSDPKKLETIMTRIPVLQLDSSLGITYKNMNSTGLVVNDEKQLAMALANPNMKVIDLGTTVITGDVRVNRNVTIKGGTITENILLGDGTEDLTIRLDGVNITKDLTIDVGAEGTAIVSASTISGTTIVRSGAEKSIHLHDFTSTNGITLENTTPVRIITSYTKDFDIKAMKIKLASDKEVTLEGLAGELTVNIGKDINAKMTVKNSKGEMKKGTDEDQGKLDLKVPDKVKTPSPEPEGWTVGKVDSVIEDGKEVVNMELLPLSKSKEQWDGGVDLDGLNDLNLPVGMSITVEKPKVLGTDSIASIIGNYKLKITGEIEKTMGEVIIKGEADGKIYKIKVNVTILSD